MKLVGMLAITLFAGSVLAGQVIYHGYDGALRGIEVANACVTNNNVQTITATRNCLKLVPVERGQGDDKYTDWVCEKWETSTLAYPRAFTKTVCVEYGTDGSPEGGNLICKRSEQRADFLPDTITISVVTSNGDHDDYPGVSRQFTFPICN